ncbi:MAG: hypothetical protein IJ558_06895 [Treponema sp.]|nr:hypothetical protein [Treponema sp.]
MKNENCEKKMDEFLALDKNERLPLSLTLHLLSCKKCRSQVHYLTLAERYASEPIHAASAKELFATRQPLKPVSMTKWIVWGTIMLLLMVTFGIFLNRIDHAAIFFHVLFGILVTAYCVLFVATNMDFFIKKIDKSPVL